MISNYVLSQIICGEYDANIRRKFDGKKSMCIEFSIQKPNDYKHEKHLQILIYGEGYVKVFHRINIKKNVPIKNSTTGKFDGWIMDSDHDSCWREDGIQRIINDVSKDYGITFCDGFINWYDTMDLTENDLEQLHAIRVKTYGY